MQECFQQYPELYHEEEGEEEGVEEGEGGAKNESSEVRSAPETSSSELAVTQTDSSEQS